MFLTSFIRTLFPIFWSQVVMWLVLAVPALEPVRELLLEQTDFLVITITTAVMGGWYALIRWLEPRLPAWLRTILMGSNKEPAYHQARHVADH